MEYNERTGRLAQLGPIVGILVVGALFAAFATSVHTIGWLNTIAATILLTTASILIAVWRRRALDAAHRAARRLAAYRLPPSRKPGEHRTSHRTSQLVPATWRLPTPPAGVPTYREITARRSVLALP